MTDAPAIEVKSLSKTYVDGLLRRRRFQALKDVSFHVRRGEIFGLLGPNGAGKTTFVKIMLGIVRGNGGQATLLGRPAGNHESRRRVGYMPENLRAPRYHTARTALEFYGRLSGITAAAARDRCRPVLEQVGLSEWEHTVVAKFSKGMLQRLALAQALLHDPELLFLDEPTDGLDPVGRSDVRQILHRLKQEGKTVFLNSHLLQEVEMVCDRVAILDKGELCSIGPPDQVAPDRIEGIELELELLGTGDVARQAVGTRHVTNWSALGEDQFRVVVRLAEQSEVDQLNDDLRRAGISVVGLSRRRISLEDAFLQIIAAAGKRE